MKTTDYNFLNFVSLSGKKMELRGVIDEISVFMREDPSRDYRVVLGTDSEGYGYVSYASAIVVHRVGNGGRAFICKNKIQTPVSLRQKIYNEATLSLLLAQELVPLLTEFLGEEFVKDNLVIHIDVGQNGETKDMIREVVGMVKGSGFQVETKPNSYAASNVADRFVSPPGREPKIAYASA